MASLWRLMRPVQSARHVVNFTGTGVRAFSVSSSNQKETVGFVGLGNMGNHMARNLIKNGYSLVVFDVNTESVNALKSDGASVASSPAEVATASTKIVTMLPESSHVLEVYTGSKGIFSGIQQNSLLLDSSTIDPSVSQQMASIASKSQSIYFDAPVSGGVNAACDALLTFMVGGPEPQFKAAKQLLDLMGKNVVYCGDVGTGQAAKICNNMLLGISMLGTAETMNLGMKLGLDPKLLAKILNMSSGRCWSSDTYNPVPGVLDGVPSSNDYKGGFGTSLMTKDLGLAQSAAIAKQIPTPLGSMALHLYRTMCNKGLGGKDFSIAYKYLQNDKK